MSERLSCAVHEKHNRRCGACAEADMPRLTEELYPSSILDPWKARVAANPVLHENWTAGIWPMGHPNAPVGYRLTRWEAANWGSVTITLSGTDQVELLMYAENFDLADLDAAR